VGPLRYGDNVVGSVLSKLSMPRTIFAWISDCVREEMVGGRTVQTLPISLSLIPYNDHSLPHRMRSIDVVCAKTAMNHCSGGSACTVSFLRKHFTTMLERGERKKKAPLFVCFLFYFFKNVLYFKVFFILKYFKKY
jgi:hypothetical protein